MKNKFRAYRNSPYQTLTEGQGNRDFLRGASLCRCITFSDNLPHLKARGTAPDGHKINNRI